MAYLTMVRGYLSKTAGLTAKDFVTAPSMADAGRARALQTLSGENTFNVQHPLISDALAGTGTGLAGVAAGSGVGLGLSKLFGAGDEDQKAFMAYGGLGVGVLGAILGVALTRAARRKSLARLKKNKLGVAAKASAQRLLKNHANSGLYNKVEATLGSLLGAGFEHSGYVNTLRKILGKKVSNRAREQMLTSMVGDAGIGSLISANIAQEESKI